MSGIYYTPRGKTQRWEEVPANSHLGTLEQPIDENLQRSQRTRRQRQDAPQVTRANRTAAQVAETPAPPRPDAAVAALMPFVAAPPAQHIPATAPSLTAPQAGAPDALGPRTSLGKRAVRGSRDNPESSGEDGGARDARSPSGEGLSGQRGVQSQRSKKRSQAPIGLEDEDIIGNHTTRTAQADPSLNAFTNAISGPHSNNQSQGNTNTNAPSGSAPPAPVSHPVLPQNPGMHLSNQYPLVHLLEAENARLRQDNAILRAEIQRLEQSYGARARDLKSSTIENRRLKDQLRDLQQPLSQQRSSAPAAIQHPQQTYAAAPPGQRSIQPSSYEATPSHTNFADRHTTAPSHPSHYSLHHPPALNNVEPHQARQQGYPTQMLDPRLAEVDRNSRTQLNTPAAGGTAIERQRIQSRREGSQQMGAAYGGAGSMGLDGMERQNDGQWPWH